MTTTPSFNLPPNPQKKEAITIRKLSLVSIIGNVSLSVFKMFAGVNGKSSAMISDAVHSISDVLTTVIAYFGVKISKKKEDKAHPYGHDRLECVASLVLGIVLAITGVGIGIAGVDSIVSGNYKTLPIPSAVALVAAIVSIVGKEAMYWYTRYYAKKINSAAFMADAWHHRSDALSSIGSLIGIGGAMLGFPILDCIAGIVICLFIIKVAYDVIKDALKKMLDTACDEKYEEQLRLFIEGQEGVVGIDSLRTRQFGNKVYVELEIRMDGAKTLQECHDVSKRVHNSVELNFPEIKHIMIHVNPIGDSQ